MNTITNTTSHDLNRWLNRATVIAAILYTLSFFYRVLKGYLARKAGVNADIEWAIPDNPQSMIALCWVSAAINLCFMHEVGKLLAALSFAGMIGFFLHWASLTSNIKVNLGVTSIPNTGPIGNLWFGAGIADAIAFVVGAIILGWDLWLLKKNYQIRIRREGLSRGSGSTNGSMAFDK